jgi:hypothetical protein
LIRAQAGTRDARTCFRIASAAPEVHGNGTSACSLARASIQLTQVISALGTIVPPEKLTKYGVYSNR